MKTVVLSAVLVLTCAQAQSSVANDRQEVQRLNTQLDTLQEKINQMESIPMQKKSRDYRNARRLGLNAGIGIFSNLPGYSVRMDYYFNPNHVLGLSFFRTGTYRKSDIDFDRSYEPLNVHADGLNMHHKYFTNNSFYLDSTLGVRRYANRLSSLDPLVDSSSSDQTDIQIGFGIGNQWNIGAFTIGAKWRFFTQFYVTHQIMFN